MVTKSIRILAVVTSGTLGTLVTAGIMVTVDTAVTAPRPPGAVYP